MPATIRIDTLNFVRKLTAAGTDRPIAEAIAESVAEADTSELVTKTDLAELKSEIFWFMLVQSVGIVGLTVGLMKLLP